MSGELFQTAVSSSLAEFESRSGSSLAQRETRKPRGQRVIRIHAKPRRSPEVRRAKSRAAPELPASQHQHGKLFVPAGNTTVRSRRQLEVSPQTRQAIADPLTLPQSIPELKDSIYQVSVLQSRHIDSGEYVEAQEMQKLLSSMQRRLKSQESKKSSSQEVETVLVKRQELQAIVDTIVGEWDAQFQEFLSVTQAEVEALKADQMLELEEFDANEPDDLLPKYRQRSANLIALRDKERCLALNKRFIDAQQAKTKADRQELVETEAQFARMKKDRMKQRDIVVKRQQRQLQVFFAHAEMTRVKMIQQRDTGIEGHLGRIEKLDAQLDDMGAKNPKALDSVADCKVSKARARQVVDGEYSYPIVRMRPGSAFMAARTRRDAI